MQGMYDVYYTLNTYLINETWTNATLPYSMQNLSLLKIQPDYYYDNFLGEKLLDIAFADQRNPTLTLEYNPFMNMTLDDNLTFLKASNLMLGIQMIFTPYSLSSEETISFNNIEGYLFDSIEEIINNNITNDTSQNTIFDQWKEFVAPTSS